MISAAIILTAVVFVLIALLFGINRAIGSLPALFLFMLLMSIFGWVVIQLFPVILVLMVIAYIRNRNNPKKGKNFYYKTYRAEDFEEFFRNQGNGGYSYGRTYGGSSQGNTFGGFEDKTKYYKILGVSETATPDEIKKAYRDLAKKHHPDRYANAEADIRETHERKFKEINEAYEKLHG